WQVREPELEVLANRGDLGHAGDDPHQPVAPTGGEPSPRADEFTGVLGERTADRAVHQQFAERAHDEEDHQSSNRIDQDQPRADLVERFAGAEKEADTYRAADGDHVDVPAAQFLAVFPGCWLVHRSGLLTSVSTEIPRLWVGSQHPWTEQVAQKLRRYSAIGVTDGTGKLVVLARFSRSSSVHYGNSSGQHGRMCDKKHAFSGAAGEGVLQLIRSDVGVEGERVGQGFDAGAQLGAGVLVEVGLEGLGDDVGDLGELG